jgi:DNA-binding GntR family transcriptional regulator
MHVNERERAYQKIREAITYGQLKPGERLVEINLCELFKIGRTPIREALRQLQMEGYIEVLPNKGAVVKKVTVEELEWVYCVLSAVEAYAAELSTKKATESEMRVLLDIHEGLNKAMEEENYEAWFNGNNLFHDYIHRFSGNPILSDEITRLRNRCYRNRRFTISLQQTILSYINEHKLILDAMIQGDSEKAAVAMRAHLDNARIENVNRKMTHLDSRNLTHPRLS